MAPKAIKSKINWASSIEVFENMIDTAPWDDIEEAISYTKPAELRRMLKDAHKYRHEAKDKK